MRRLLRWGKNPFTAISPHVNNLNPNPAIVWRTKEAAVAAATDLDMDGKPDDVVLTPTDATPDTPFITIDEDSINIDLDNDGTVDVEIPR